MVTISSGKLVPPLSFLQQLLPLGALSKKGTLLLPGLEEKRVEPLREKDSALLFQHSVQIDRVRAKSVEELVLKKAKDEIFDRLEKACEQWKKNDSSETRALLKQIGTSIESQKNLWLTEAKGNDLRSQYDISKWQYFFDYYDQLIELGSYDSAIEEAEQRCNEVYRNLVKSMEQVFATAISGWVGTLGEPFGKVKAIGDYFGRNISRIIAELKSKGKSKHTFQVCRFDDWVEWDFVVKIRRKLQAGQGYVEVSQEIAKRGWKRIEARAVLTQHVAEKVWDSYAYAKLLKRHRKTPEGERVSPRIYSR